MFGCAILSIPPDIEERTALRLPSLLMTLGIVAPVLTAMMRDAKIVLRAECVVVLSPIFWLLIDPLQGRYDLAGLTPEDVQRSFTAIALFVAGVWLATIWRPRQAPRWVYQTAKLEFSSTAWFVAGAVAFTLALLRFAIPADFDFAEMFAALGRGRWEAPWTRGELGGADAILDHFSYSGFLLPPIAVLLARRAGWRDGRTVALIIMTVVISLFLSQGGGRRITGVLFCSAAALWFLSEPKVRPPTLIILALSGVCLIVVLEFLLDYRNVGWHAYLDPQTRAEIQDAKQDEQAIIRVDDNFYRLAQITSIFPEAEPFVTWRYPLWILARPVPRCLWPSKPLDPGFNLADLVEVQGASLSASTIGELYAAGGLLAAFLGGMLFGLISGILARLLDESANESALLIYSIGLLALFAGMRSMIELLLMSYGIVAWIVIARFMQIWHERSAHS